MPLEGDPQTLLEVLEMLAALWQQRENGCFDFFNMYPEGKSWRPRRLEQPVLDGCWFEGASLPLRRGQMVVVLADFSFFSLEQLCVWNLVEWDRCNSPPYLTEVITQEEKYILYTYQQVDTRHHGEGLLTALSLQVMLHFHASFDLPIIMTS